jgi:phenylpropionate dioxygenase-like ring-hydroxylating dioxygenase large terminal subunit
MKHRADASRALETIFSQIEAMAARDGVAPTLPAGCYTSAEFFEFERERVFAASWVCVGREEQIPQPGDHLAVRVAGEALLVVRTEQGEVHAMSAVCQHRGQVITEVSGQGADGFRCPLHFWTYDLKGALKGAPHMGSKDELACLRRNTRLPAVRVELWHGFVFVNLDADAAPLAPGLAKVEPFWGGYRDAGLVAVPPVMASQPLPWNWKIHVENFTDAYHPGFVHRGTHDIAPSVHADGGVVFTHMADGDQAIVRTVPLLKKDGGMMRDGWGEEPMFPAIDTLSDAQRQRLTFVLMPPSMTLVFAPGAVAYTLLSADGVLATYASSDRVTGGGWLLPRSTVERPDFQERAGAVREGAAKIWAQDVPVNTRMQAGKSSRFQPAGTYGPLETTLVQFNAWLLRAYQRGLRAMA